MESPDRFYRKKVAQPKPTAAGSALYRHARLILGQIELIREEVREDVDSEIGTVAVGLPTTTAAVLALPLFSHVRRQFPGIRLQIFESTSGYVNEMLRNGNLDLALLFRDSETRGLLAIPVFDEELYVLGSAGLLLDEGDTDCPLATLANVPLVTPSSANGLRFIIERTFQRENIELNIVADIDSLPTLIEVARDGSACTILPSSARARCAPDMRPAMRRIVEPLMSRPISVCWSRAMPVSAAALAVRKAVIGLIGKLHAQDKWTGITLRTWPDEATLSDSGLPLDEVGRQ